MNGLSAVTNAAMSGLRIVTSHPPSRLHSLCYLFQEDDGQRSLVWYESDRRAGLYDLRHYMVVIDPDQVPDVSDVGALLTLARTGKDLGAPETLMADSEFHAVSHRIRDWDARMAANPFTRATLGEPRLFSHHANDRDDFLSPDNFSGGTRQDMVGHGWLAVAR